MNKPTKPISSPGKSDKFPPPLMRFLKTNIGNKSRRRSRATPLFFRKKNTPIETTQEPSSPKVTCIGQVRVRCSTKTTTTHHRRRHNNRFSRCLRNLKCLSFFRCGSYKQEEDKEENQEHVIKLEHDNVNEGLIQRSPPKNVLLLTRCRSVPYKSSSLANIIREEVEEKIGNLKIEKKEEEEVIAVENKEVSDETCEELKAVKPSALILTRCKSEPARIWDQLLL